MPDANIDIAIEALICEQNLPLYEHTLDVNIWSTLSSCLLIALAAPLAVRSMEAATISTNAIDSVIIKGFGFTIIDISNEAIE